LSILPAGKRPSQFLKGRAGHSFERIKMSATDFLPTKLSETTNGDADSVVMNPACLTLDLQVVDSLQNVSRPPPFSDCAPALSFEGTAHETESTRR
jgi:hypothetical protein